MEDPPPLADPHPRPGMITWWMVVALGLYADEAYLFFSAHFNLKFQMSQLGTTKYIPGIWYLCADLSTPRTCYCIPVTLAEVGVMLHVSYCTHLACNLHKYCRAWAASQNSLFWFCISREKFCKVCKCACVVTWIILFSLSLLSLSLSRRIKRANLSARSPCFKSRKGIFPCFQITNGQKKKKKKTKRIGAQGVYGFVNNN